MVISLTNLLAPASKAQNPSELDMRAAEYTMQEIERDVLVRLQKKVNIEMVMRSG